MEGEQLLWDSSSVPQQPLLVVKPEPRQYIQQLLRPQYPAEHDDNYGSQAFDYYADAKEKFAKDTADADLLDIKMEELCYMTGENGEGFVFVEPKACDESGYETSNSATSSYACNTLNPTTVDHDWIDSPSSVESLLSSCSEFCDYQTNVSQQCPPQLYINPPNSPSAVSSSINLPLTSPSTSSDHISHRSTMVPAVNCLLAAAETETEMKQTDTIQCKPMMPTLLVCPTSSQNSSSRYVP